MSASSPAVLDVLLEVFTWVGFGGAVVREASVTPLAPARRKALTLAFARLGALRTMRE